VARARRGPGNRRLLAPLLVLIVAALALGLSASAIAASGGASAQSGVKRHRISHRGRAAALGGRGMWVWELGSSNGGNVASIIAQAKHYGVSTLMIKSGDGTTAWSQFNPQLVAALHANGLRACAWQYVYGNHPVTEAQVGAAAVRAGANCLLIDAESEYEGKYVQAQTYIQKLRSLIGQNFPLALAGFPYMDFHPGFPYSVFLGPGGAQYNAPQMYWKDIGTTVDAVYAHTYAYNRLYQRPIFPLGQVYNGPPARQIRRFRQVSFAYGANGVSWWDWQEAPLGAWQAISQPAGPITGYGSYDLYATLGVGAAGDVVVWAQEHLVSAGEAITIDGAFGPKTQAAVEAFQIAQGLAPTGIIDTPTWQALLRYSPVHVKWVVRRHKLTATAAAAGLRLVPKSASLRAKRYEIPRSFGSGAPSAQTAR
jgi:Putative peptidoglycan binding domain